MEFSDKWLAYDNVPTDLRDIFETWSHTMDINAIQQSNKMHGQQGSSSMPPMINGGYYEVSDCQEWRPQRTVSNSGLLKSRFSGAVVVYLGKRTCGICMRLHHDSGHIRPRGTIP